MVYEAKPENLLWEQGRRPTSADAAILQTSLSNTSTTSKSAFSSITLEGMFLIMPKSHWVPLLGSEFSKPILIRVLKHPSPTSSDRAKAGEKRWSTGKGDVDLFGRSSLGVIPISACQDNCSSVQ